MVKYILCNNDIIGINMTTAMNMRYTLENVNEIIFNGFDYTIPEETLKLISEIALQVGSPDYVKTPVFKKQEVNTSSTSRPRDSGYGNCVSVSNGHGHSHNHGSGKKRNKPAEVLNNEEWDRIKTVDLSKTDEKSNIDMQIDQIRINLNKLTDKNYIDIRNKVFSIIDGLIRDSEDMARISTIIFDIASTNRFYSKLYADLYSDLSSKYAIMRTIIETNIGRFTDLFNTIEYVDPNVNYDRFCEINKKNEKRKALAVFYLNLMSNGIIQKDVIIDITVNLLTQLCEFLGTENKKNEVDELTETIAILYKRELHKKNGKDIKVGEHTVVQFVEFVAKSKVKDHKSLTNKALFKFMDLVEM